MLYYSFDKPLRIAGDAQLYPSPARPGGRTALRYAEAHGEGWYVWHAEEPAISELPLQLIDTQIVKAHARILTIAGQHAVYPETTEIVLRSISHNIGGGLLPISSAEEAVANGYESLAQPEVEAYLGYMHQKARVLSFRKEPPGATELGRSLGFNAARKAKSLPAGLEALRKSRGGLSLP